MREVIAPEFHSEIPLRPDSKVELKIIIYINIYNQNHNTGRTTKVQRLRP